MAYHDTSIELAWDEGLGIVFQPDSSQLIFAGGYDSTTFDLSFISSSNAARIVWGLRQAAKDIEARDRKRLG